MRTRELARWLATSTLLVVAGFVVERSSGDDTEAAPPKKPPKKATTLETERVDVPKLMQRKLDSSQRILRGLVRGEMRDVRDGADVLNAIARTRDWAARDDDAVFSHFNVEFQRLSGKLGRMAEQRNLEGAAYVYNQLTSTCIGCHEHVRDVKKVPKIVPLSGPRDEE